MTSAGDNKAEITISAPPGTALEVNVTSKTMDASTKEMGAHSDTSETELRIRKPLYSYLKLILCFLISIYVFKTYAKGIDAITEVIEIIFISKILKMISYFFIFFSILDWGINIRANSPNHQIHRMLSAACLLFTILTVIWLLIQISAMMSSGKEVLKIEPLLDTFIAMTPIFTIAFSNWIIMTQQDDCDHADIKRSARLFLLYLYLPMVLATIIILLFATWAHIRCMYNYDLLQVMIAGSMAFLVFIAHVADKMIHENSHSPRDQSLQKKFATFFKAVGNAWERS